MKSLLYFLILNTAALALSHPAKLDVAFFFKDAKQIPNNITQVKANVLIDKNGRAELSCGENKDYTLVFNVQEQNENIVKIETKIFNDTTLISKPVMVISYNHRGIMEMGETIAPNSEISEFSLSIIPSKGGAEISKN